MASHAGQASLGISEQLRRRSMKRTLIWCLSGLVLLVSVAGLHAQQTAGTAKAVTALEHQWLEAQKTSNPGLLAPLLADNFVSTSPDGKVTGKSEALENAKSQKWTSAEYSDEKVSVYGDTAIATGGFKGTGTDTGVKMPKGKWNCVASHVSTVKL